MYLLLGRLKYIGVSPSPGPIAQREPQSAGSTGPGEGAGEAVCVVCVPVDAWGLLITMEAILVEHDNDSSSSSIRNKNEGAAVRMNTSERLGGAESGAGG